MRGVKNGSQPDVPDNAASGVLAASQVPATSAKALRILEVQTLLVGEPSPLGPEGCFSGGEYIA